MLKTCYSRKIYIRFEKWIIKRNLILKKDNYRKAYETNKSRLHFAKNDPPSIFLSRLSFSSLKLIQPFPLLTQPSRSTTSSLKIHDTHGYTTANGIGLKIQLGLPPCRRARSSKKNRRKVRKGRWGSRLKFQRLVTITTTRAPGAPRSSNINI